MSEIRWHDVVEDLPVLDDEGETVGWTRHRTIAGISDGQVRFRGVPVDASAQVVGMARSLIARDLTQAAA